jgi:hypothetical protein
MHSSLLLGLFPDSSLTQEQHLLPGTIMTVDLVNEPAHSRTVLEASPLVASMLQIPVVGSLATDGGDTEFGASDLGGQPRQVLEILLLNFGSGVSKTRTGGHEMSRSLVALDLDLFRTLTRQASVAEPRAASALLAEALTLASTVPAGGRIVEGPGEPVVGLRVTGTGNTCYNDPAPAEQRADRAAGNRTDERPRDPGGLDQAVAAYDRTP